MTTRDTAADLKTLGKRFADRRKDMGFTQAALGSELDVTRETVADWERGARRIPKMAWLALDGIGTERARP